MTDREELAVLLMRRSELLQQNSLALGPFIAWPATPEREIEAALVVGRPLMRVHFVTSDGNGRPRDS